MLRRSILAVSVLILALVVGSIGTAASTKPAGYPARSIEVVVAFGPGGGTDIFARSIGMPLRKILGVPLVITNISGAAGAVGTAYVGKQPADGYTILAIGTDMVITDAFKRCEFTHDDFVPIARVQHDQSMFWVRKDSPYKTIQDVIADAKANPGKVKFGITSPAGFDEVLVSKFAKEAGIKVTIVPFNAGSETSAALLGGHVDIMHEEPGPAISLYESKMIRPLVVMTDERLPAFPDVPTAKELGYDVTLGIWRGFFVKKGTPPEIVKYLEEAVKKASQDPVYKAVERQQMLDQRPGFLGSEDTAKFVEQEYGIYSEILRDLGYIK